MTTITHVCAGYLLAQGAIYTELIPPQMGHQFTAISIIAANLPDFDVLNIKKILDHRNSILHVPLYWFLLLSGLFFLFNRFHLDMLVLATSLTAVNILLHFIMDTYTPDAGIKWLAPFNDREFGPLVGDIKPITIKDITKSYLRKPLFKYELAFWISTLILRSKVF